MKIARLRGLLTCFLLLFFSLGLPIAVSADEQGIEPLLKWVCQKMDVDFADVIRFNYPEVVEMDRNDFQKFVKTIPMIERKFGKRVDEIVAIYQPVRNKIYIIKNSPRHYLIHELVHFIQFQIKKVFPEKTELDWKVIEAAVEDLENEARSIELLYLKQDKKQARF